MINDMNINIHIDINMNIDIPPPPHAPPPGPVCGRPKHGVGVGWGDINSHIDINMNIYIHIIINMNDMLGGDEPIQGPQGARRNRYGAAYVRTYLLYYVYTYGSVSW